MCNGDQKKKSQLQLNIFLHSLRQTRLNAVGNAERREGCDMYPAKHFIYNITYKECVCDSNTAYQVLSIMIVIKCMKRKS